MEAADNTVAEAEDDDTVAEAEDVDMGVEVEVDDEQAGRQQELQVLLP